MSISAELALRVKISDPKPDRCAACFQGAQDNVRFVDYDAAIDRGTLINDMGAVLSGIDDLHLCESCVRQGMEALELKPELHSRQLREIRRLGLVAEHWRERCADLQRLIGKFEISEPS
jgi:hypothetical protein